MVLDHLYCNVTTRKSSLAVPMSQIQIRCSLYKPVATSRNHELQRPTKDQSGGNMEG